MVQLETAGLGQFKLLYKRNEMSAVDKHPLIKDFDCLRNPGNVFVGVCARPYPEMVNEKENRVFTANNNFI